MSQRLRSFLVVATVMALSFCHRPLHEPPVVALLEPANNALVPKVVRVRALAGTVAGIREARLMVDGELTLTQTECPDSVLTFIWNASEMTPWSRHSIAVEVTDNDAYYGSSDSVSVVIAATSGPTAHEGPITRDETWYAAGSPHLVKANLAVEAVLAIEPGCVVEFSNGGGLLIGDGALVANGASSLITFTGRQATPGAWRSIEFRDRARPDVSVLDNCLFEYGGGSAAMACVVVDAPVRISNCVFRSSAKPGLAIGPMLVPYIGDCNLFSGNYPEAILITGEYIHADTRWENHGVPYLVESGLYVYSSSSDQTATFSIGPGTTILFGSDAGIGIDYEGAVVADGSSGMIVLTSEDLDDDWGGIEFNGWGSLFVQGVFKNCLIQNGGYDGAAVQAWESVIEMENTVINRSVEFGIICGDGSYFASFRNNVITGCCYRAMVLDVEFVPTIGEGNSFTGNDIDGDYHDGIELVNRWDGIQTSATWRNLGVPYILKDDIELSEQNGTLPILTLEPGVRLEFDNAGLLVYDGALVADGTSGRITFTGYSTSNTWRGIIFRSTPDAPQSILRNCIVEYGGYWGGNIVCDSCAPVIEDNEISHSSQFGILLHNSPLSPDSLLAQNRFHDNDSGDVAVRPQFTIPPQPPKARSVSRPSPHSRELRNRPPGLHPRHEIRPAAAGIEPREAVRLPRLRHE
jgi:hypothetical protein